MDSGDHLFNPRVEQRFGGISGQDNAADAGAFERGDECYQFGGIDTDNSVRLQRGLVLQPSASDASIVAG
jgi:hypothetical protein